MEHSLFESMNAAWTLTKVSNDETKVSLDIELALRNPLYSELLSKVSGSVAETLMHAFIERAKVEQIKAINKSNE